jgi:hypothetical protein
MIRIAPGKFLRASVLIAATLAIVSEANADKPLRLQRAEAVRFAAGLFKRFFFVEWLGEPFSLQGVGNCGDDIILRATQDKAAFPESLKRQSLEPGNFYLKYCSPVSLTGTMTGFSVKVPMVDTCDAYLKRWNALIATAPLEEGLKPYRLNRDLYEKYDIQGQARHPLNGIDDRDDGPVLTKGQGLVRQLRLTQARESNRMCHFDFAFPD